VEALVCSSSCIKGSRKAPILDSLLIEEYNEFEKLEEGTIINACYYAIPLF